MKTIILGLLIVACSINSFAQTLNIKSIEVSDTKNYNEAADKVLGKDVTLVVYDNSLSLKLPNEAPIILRQTSDTAYERVMRDSETEIETISVRINRTLNLTTSIEIITRIDEKVGKHRTAWWKFIAKRF